jgi:hypothetical protein
VADAEKHFRQALRLSPEAPEVRRALLVTIRAQTWLYRNLIAEQHKETLRARARYSLILWALLFPHWVWRFFDHADWVGGYQIPRQLPRRRADCAGLSAIALPAGEHILTSARAGEPPSFFPQRGRLLPSRDSPLRAGTRFVGVRRYPPLGHLWTSWSGCPGAVYSRYRTFSDRPLRSLRRGALRGFQYSHGLRRGSLHVALFDWNRLDSAGILRFQHDVVRRQFQPHRRVKGKASFAHLLSAVEGESLP